jgi:hypothetical protein
VQYAVPLWLRDHNIATAITRVAGRIKPATEPRTDPVAVVGFGPSLGETWEKIKDFKYVVTCSGSHKYLIERGVIPTHHVEVDPRPHKVALLGPPHPDVEYLIASACSPKYFDHLEGMNVKLWHVFDASDEGLRTLPAGEWAVTGGCDAGLRAMTIAAFLGFRDLHIFGLDGCARGEERHAAEHPNGKQKYLPVEHEGKTYYTTAAMLVAAKQTLHELKQMPAVHATFYGEGLTQALSRGYTPAKTEPTTPYANIIAFAKPELISAEYAKLNAPLHRENVAYGVGGAKHAGVVLKLVDQITPRPRSVLDYGCGKSQLAKALPFGICEYDPAIPGKQETPKPADLVVCTDVLEHIEPDKLNYVLDDLRRCTLQLGYFVIHMGPAQKKLPDGRNTHLIQQNRKWWEKKLKKFFTIGQVIEKGVELHCVVGPRIPAKPSRPA